MTVFHHNPIDDGSTEHHKETCLRPTDTIVSLLDKAWKLQMPAMTIEEALQGGKRCFIAQVQSQR